MKRLSLIVASLLAFVVSFSQSPVRETSPESFTNQLQRVIVGRNFTLPRFPGKPTLRPSLLNGGVDTVGSQVYVYGDSTVYVYVGGDTWIKSSTSGLKLRTPFRMVNDSLDLNYSSLSFQTFSSVLAARSFWVSTQAEARAITIADANQLYYIGNDLFRYDPTDLTSPDDSAMTLVTSAGKRLKRVVFDGWINAKWFGAVGDNVTDDTYNLQRAIDWVLNHYTQYKKLKIPAGKYKLTNGLVVYRDADANGFPDFVNIEIAGENMSYAFNTATLGGTILHATHKDNFALGIQFAKGAQIHHIAFEGENDVYSLHTPSQIYSGNPEDWVKPGTRNNIYSPYAGIVIDPFHVSTAVGNRYPRMDKYYNGLVNTATTGSSDVVVSDIFMEKFLAGMIMSPNGVSQNAEVIKLQNAWIQYTRDAYCNAQSQTRQNEVINLKVWGGVHTIFNSVTYGQGNGSMPNVIGVNIAGYNYQLARLLGGWSNASFTNVYAEGLFRLGEWGTAPVGLPVSIVNSYFDIPTTYWYTSAKYIPNNIVAIGTIFRQYNNRTGFITSGGNQQTFINCMLSGPVIPYRDLLNLKQAQTVVNKAKYINCNAYGLPNLVSFGSIVSELSESSRLGWNQQAVYGVQTAKIVEQIFGEHSNANNRNAVPVTYTYEINGETDKVLHGPGENGRTLSFFPDNGTCTFISADASMYKLNDLVYQNGISGISIDGETSMTSTILGVVVGVNTGTNVVTVGSVVNINPTSVTKTNVTVQVYQQNEFQEPFVGQITSGSNVITNVHFHKRLLSIRVGTVLLHPSLPFFTRIESFDNVARTITLSKNALVTDANAVFEITRLKGHGTASQDPNSVDYTQWPGYDSGYAVIMKGSFIENVGTDNTIRGWFCTRTGFLGTVKPPVFQTIMVQGQTVANETEDLGTAVKRWRNAYIKSVGLDSILSTNVYAPYLKDSTQVQVIYTNPDNGKWTRGPLPITQDNWGTQTVAFRPPLFGAGIDGDEGSLDTTSATGAATKSNIANLQAQIDALPGGATGVNVKNAPGTGDTLSYKIADTAFIKPIEAGANIIITPAANKITISATPGSAEINTKAYTFTATDSSGTIPAGSMIETILIKPTTSLTAFTVGSQSIANEYLPATPVNASADFNILTLPIYFPTAAKLYFSGITSSTQIKIIYKPLHE